MVDCRVVVWADGSGERRRRREALMKDGCLAGCGCLGLLVAGSAWLTHVIVCLSDGRWGFLIAGAICFPIAIVHGIGLWFGFFAS